jgi:acid phosphatase type 7
MLTLDLAGDIAYADALIKETTQGYINSTITLAEGYKAYEPILDDFYDEMTLITTVKPYMVGPGNHEANSDNGGSNGYTTSVCMPGQMNFTGFKNHFRMPSEEPGGLGNFWYSYDVGMVHFFSD